jgi:hypothetical protein
MDYDWRGRMVWYARTDSGVSRSVLRTRFKIDTLLYSLLDPGAKVHIAAARSEGFQVGAYADPHWFGLEGDGHSLEFRQKCDALIANVGLQPGDHFQIDPEGCSPTWLYNTIVGAPGNRGLFASNRTQSPTGTQEDKKGSYTNMPFQNHTVVNFPAVVQGRCHWFYQKYYGDMSPADGDAICLEILRDMRAWAGQNWAEKTHAFYDGVKYTSDQRDGAYFTAERLPNVFTMMAQLHPLEEIREDHAELTKEDLRAYYKKQWINRPSSLKLSPKFNTP